MLTAIQAGAVGFLRKDTLTPESLGAAVRAAASGTGVVAPDLLGRPDALAHAGGLDGRPRRPRA